MSFSSTLLPLVSIITLGWLAIWLNNLGRRPKGYPPGPPTIPVIGNMHQMPKAKIHIQYQKWAQEYGPVFSLVLGSSVIVVLSSASAVRDLLEKRSAIYSSRPSLYISQQIASGGLRWTLMEYGDLWRRIRRIAHSALNLTASQSYVPYQDLESVQMLIGFLDSPADFMTHVQRFSLSLITQAVFGFRLPKPDHDYMRQVFRNVEQISKLAYFAALIDMFPLLKKLPDVLLPARASARRHFEDEREFLLSVWKRAKEAIEMGNTKPCFADEMYKRQKSEGLDDDLSAYSCNVIQEAAGDTSSVSVVAFIQAMILHPEVQRRCQEEIDDAFGDSLPSLEGEMSLPYLKACIKETFRWLPAAPLGIPHCVTQDDEYLGYRIPKGATVVLNIWGIHRDPDRHPQPQVFDPSRFEGTAESAANEAVSESSRDHFVFGAGRRVCPGLHIAERTMVLGAARLLWGFDFGKATDELGREISPPGDDFANGIVATPPPFKANITCRSPERAARIRQAWAECQQLLDEGSQWKTKPTR
ncbi:cytochrome P450 [Astrocystis sublimbata]|nr:cytochrome P450 [Astrocystis sublimbata]